MRPETGPAPETSLLASKFSPAVIGDDASYRAAIEKLDRLFGLANRTEAESEYYRLLARAAYEYEIEAGFYDELWGQPTVPESDDRARARSTTMEGTPREAASIVRGERPTELHDGQ
jgi:hypothetical protein